MKSQRSIFLLFVLVILFVIHVVCSEVYYSENFDENWEDRWVQSEAKTYGKFVRSAGEFYGGDGNDKGIKTSQDAHHYSISSKFEKVVSNMEKPLVIQYTVKHEQGIDCGGAYLKVLPEGLKQEAFTGDSEYRIMFGPDICGSSKKVHFIFNYKGKNLLWNKNVECASDKLTHVYTAIVNTDGTYEVQIDGEKKESGKLLEDWDFLPPKQIPDPEASKPEDWVDEAEIPDPEDKKPEDWDQPRFIQDPEASKPEDWDEEEDGEWEAPKIENPEYKGEWSPKMIPNPEYKGEWKAPMIDNPDYEYDENVGKYDDLEYVGIEIWQVKAGTIFDHILVTDNVDEAKDEMEKILNDAKEEKQKFEQAEQEKKQEEQKKAQEEEEQKKAEEESNPPQPDDDDEKKDNEHDEL